LEVSRAQGFAAASILASGGFIFATIAAITIAGVIAYCGF
jgi:hypothetical protein